MSTLKRKARTPLINFISPSSAKRKRVDYKNNTKKDDPFSNINYSNKY